MKYKIRDNKDQLAFSFRKRTTSWKNNGLVLILGLLILVFAARAAWKVYLNDRESSRAALDKQTELAKLEGREKFLQEELKQLATPSGREARLREKFGLAYPGENVAIIVEADPAEATSTPSGIWSEIRDFFKGIFK